MAELKFYTPEMTWEPLALFPGDAEAKILRLEAAGGARTLLVRLQPGCKIVPHSHLAAVQHYVLEGEYETEGEIFRAGTYRLLPKDVDVGTISTQTGTTILMIYDPAG
ncbi:MAG TPA: cupin domain-containing protein [Candidatus Binatia bacterium]|jgi:quercetin dioxygenase-like cupin family protein